MANNIIILVGRILLAVIFIASGIGKFADPASTAGMISGAGLPAATALTYLAAIFETVAGLAILVGFQTKIASYLLAAFCVFSGFMFHTGGADPMWVMINQIMLFKNLAIAGGFLVLSVLGAGSISFDARRG